MLHFSCRYDRIVVYFRKRKKGGGMEKFFRSAGILMPIFSLPSPYGIGTLGKAAYRFVDFLCESCCRVWQVLPLQPTSFGNSPYSSCASGVFNPYFIDLDLLQEEGLLDFDDYRDLEWGSDSRRVDYGAIYNLRKQVLFKAFSRFDRTSAAWRSFVKEEKFHDFACFMALKEHFGGAACETWGKYAEYDEELVAGFECEHAEEVAYWQFTQYIFLRQWKALKAYANERGVKIMGDMPIYVARDSVEVWKYKWDLFQLDEQGNLAAQAGVPPDAFSDDGQLWGNPVYCWREMDDVGKRWWENRIKDALAVYDILRIDHFIGFVRYYRIPIDATTAKKGKWYRGPGAKLFKAFKDAPIVAEDLGIVTDLVRSELDKTGYPGMKILQHAFDGDPDNEHKPSNYTENVVAYTGTHDNETLVGRIHRLGTDITAFKKDVRSECVKAFVVPHLKTDKGICGTLLRLLYASKARLIVFPLQDALCMGSMARINAPSTVSDANWSFRFLEKDFTPMLAKRLNRLAKQSDRN